MDEPTVRTDLDTFADAFATAPSGTRLPVEVSVVVSDPFDAYRRARDGPGGAFLETSGGQPGWSYFGIDPIERMTISPTATRWTGTDSKTERSAGAGRFEGADDSPTLMALQARLDATNVNTAYCDTPIPCGAIGYLSYDLARELEDLPATTSDDRNLPQLELAIYDTLVAYQVPQESPVELIVSACPAKQPGEDAQTCFDRGQKRALRLVDQMRAGTEPLDAPREQDGKAVFESDCGREAFADRVRQVKEYIRDGDTFQANVSQRLSAPATVHPVAAYDALRSVNPAPYSALLEFRSADLVSASPELLLDRDGDELVTEPIAGTRPRGTTDADDAELEAELTSDEKERAEHAMLVDLERNDLGKVATYGSVAVSEYRRVDRYSEVMHLVSEVTGTLRNGTTLADAIAAMFPGGTITGAPKPRTMEIIDEVESTRRGPYTGSIGIFGFDGRATLNIIIRTLVRTNDTYHLRVGAGIVEDSIPEREYAETLDKGRALVMAVDEALDQQRGMTVDEVSGDD